MPFFESSAFAKLESSHPDTTVYVEGLSFRMKAPTSGPEVEHAFYHGSNSLMQDQFLVEEEPWILITRKVKRSVSTDTKRIGSSFTNRDCKKSVLFVDNGYVKQGSRKGNDSHPTKTSKEHMHMSGNKIQETASEKRVVGVNATKSNKVQILKECMKDCKCDPCKKVKKIIVAYDNHIEQVYKNFMKEIESINVSYEDAILVQECTTDKKKFTIGGTSKQFKKVTALNKAKREGKMPLKVDPFENNQYKHLFYTHRWDHNQGTIDYKELCKDIGLDVKPVFIQTVIDHSIRRKQGKPHFPKDTYEPFERTTEVTFDGVPIKNMGKKKFNVAVDDCIKEFTYDECVKGMKKLSIEQLVNDCEDMDEGRIYKKEFDLTDSERHEFYKELNEIMFPNKNGFVVPEDYVNKRMYMYMLVKRIKLLRTQDEENPSQHSWFRVYNVRESIKRSTQFLWVQLRGKLHVNNVDDVVTVNESNDENIKSLHKLRCKIKQDLDIMKKNLEDNQDASKYEKSLMQLDIKDYERLLSNEIISDSEEENSMTRDLNQIEVLLDEIDNTWSTKKTVTVSDKEIMLRVDKKIQDYRYSDDFEFTGKNILDSDSEYEQIGMSIEEEAFVAEEELNVDTNPDNVNIDEGIDSPSTVLVGDENVVLPLEFTDIYSEQQENEDMTYDIMYPLLETRNVEMLDAPLISLDRTSPSVMMMMNIMQGYHIMSTGSNFPNTLTVRESISIYQNITTRLINLYSIMRFAFDHLPPHQYDNISVIDVDVKEEEVEVVEPPTRKVVVQDVINIPDSSTTTPKVMRKVTMSRLKKKKHSDESSDEEDDSYVPIAPFSEYKMHSATLPTPFISATPFTYQYSHPQQDVDLYTSKINGSYFIRRAAYVESLRPISVRDKSEDDKNMSKLYRILSKDIDILPIFSPNPDPNRRGSSWVKYKIQLFTVLSKSEFTFNILDNMGRLNIDATAPYYALRAAGIVLYSRLSESARIIIRDVQCNDVIAMLVQFDLHCQGADPAYIKQFMANLHSRRIQKGEVATKFVNRMIAHFTEAANMNVNISSSDQVDYIIEGIRPDRRYDSLISQFTQTRRIEEENGMRDELHCLTVDKIIRAFTAHERNMSIMPVNKIRTMTNDRSSYQVRKDYRNSDTQYANEAHVSNKTTAKKQKAIKCFFCMGPHRLGDCPTATPEQKTECFNEFKAKQAAKYGNSANAVSTSTKSTTKNKSKKPNGVMKQPFTVNQSMGNYKKSNKVSFQEEAHMADHEQESDDEEDVSFADRMRMDLIARAEARRNAIPDPAYRKIVKVGAITNSIYDRLHQRYRDLSEEQKNESDSEDDETEESKGRKLSRRVFSYGTYLRLAHDDDTYGVQRNRDLILDDMPEHILIHERRRYRGLPPIRGGKRSLGEEPHNFWLIDSGSTSHMSPFASDFERIDESQDIGSIKVANGNRVPIRGKGLVRLGINTNMGEVILPLQDVLYVPGLKKRLISTDVLGNYQHIVTMHPLFVEFKLKHEDNYLKPIRFPRYYKYNEEDSSIEWPLNREHMASIYARKKYIYYNPIFLPRKGIRNRLAGERSDIVEQSSDEENEMLVENDEEAYNVEVVMKRQVPIKLLHHRLGHRSYETLKASNNDDIWNDVKVVNDPETICETCQITKARLANRSKNPPDYPTAPGVMIYIDIITNPFSKGLTKQSHFTSYLLIVDAYSHLPVLLGMNAISSEEVFRCIMIFRTMFRPSIDDGDINADMNAYNLRGIRTDAGSQLTSQELCDLCLKEKISVSFAAPKHQEMNGLCERTWQSIRNIAFSFMNYARVGNEYGDFALEHAWKVYSVIPVKTLQKDERLTTPYELFYGKKPSLRKYRVLFCPCVYKIHSRETKISRTVVQRYNSKNHPQRGVTGIFIGFPRDYVGYLIWEPRSKTIRVSADVSFDENFSSAGPQRHFSFRDALPVSTASDLPVSEYFENSVPIDDHFGPPRMEYLEDKEDDGFDFFTTQDNNIELYGQEDTADVPSVRRGKLVFHRNLILWRSLVPTTTQTTLKSTTMSKT